MKHEKFSYTYTDELPDGQRFVVLAHLTAGGYEMLGSTGNDLDAEKLVQSGFDLPEVDWVTTLVPLGMYTR